MHIWRACVRLMLTVLAFVTGATALRAQLPAAPSYETVFYDSGSLKIEAYFYKPAGPGPFPLVVYNHGSRAGQERTEWAVPHIARILVPAGYAVLVPERRGYGKSGGATFSEEIGADRGPRFVARLTAEASDANAAVEYAKAHLPIDTKHIMMVGWSFGGIVTTIAAGDSPSLVAIVNQAPGALNWNRSADLRRALLASAAKIRVPALCMAAENDLTTENARAICDRIRSTGTSADTIIYPPFDDARGGNPSAPGHAIFGAAGASIWQNDLLAFLAKHRG